MEAELALKRLQKEVDRVIVVGFSMGGLIAMYLALRYKIDKLVLLSAAAKYISPRILLKEMRNHVGKTGYEKISTKYILSFVRVQIDPYAAACHIRIFTHRAKSSNLIMV